MRRGKLLFSTILATVLGMGVVGGVLATRNTRSAKKVEAAYNSTIRVYVDLSGFGTIDYVRIGSKEATNNAVLTSSNAKYNQSLGQYVFDFTSTTHYDKMGFYFSEYSTWWQYEYDDGWVWIDGGFDPGYEYQFKNIGYKSGSGPKYFNCEKYKIGEITDNVSNATVYFVDGYSWHSSGNVYVHYWGGTASSTYPGSAMSDTSLRLKAYVGETEYSGLRIYKYTISGSCAYVQFNNNSSKTGDLRPVNNGVYYYGVNDTYEPVVQLLITLGNQMGSYSYGGETFTKSICALSQSQASSFISKYDELLVSHGSRIASSVQGSAVVTYTDPDVGTSSTGEVLLGEIKEALLKKYPSLSSSFRFSMLGGFESAQSTTTVIIIFVSILSVTAVAGYFLVRKKKQK